MEKHVLWTLYLMLNVILHIGVSSQDEYHRNAYSQRHKRDERISSYLFRKEALEAHNELRRQENASDMQYLVRQRDTVIPNICFLFKYLLSDPLLNISREKMYTRIRTYSPLL